MILEDRHIEYLTHVSEKRITVRDGKYHLTNWVDGFLLLEQSIAIRVELLGMTHIIYDRAKKCNIVALTAVGLLVLQEEFEAWG